MIRYGIGHHRRYTDNHTWHARFPGRSLFIKANPHRDEAQREIHGHHLIRDHYRVPTLHYTGRLGRWTITAYALHLVDGPHDMLLDDHLALAHPPSRFDDHRRTLVGAYRSAINATLRHIPQQQSVSKLYGQRVRPGGRLDHYYSHDTSWPLAHNYRLRPTTLARYRLTVNGVQASFDLQRTIRSLRHQFLNDQHIWAAITQGDPTGMNIAVTPQGPLWFDYDTAGVNSLAGEFSCFLADQIIFGSWLTAHQNPTAFRGRPTALTVALQSQPLVETHRTGHDLHLTYTLRTPPTRQLLTEHYLDTLVEPIAATIGVPDIKQWLAPYLATRILGVYPLHNLRWSDTATLLGLLTALQEPTIDLRGLLGLPQPTSRAT